jgi:hypothetical protein
VVLLDGTLRLPLSCVLWELPLVGLCWVVSRRRRELEPVIGGPIVGGVPRPPRVVALQVLPEPVATSGVFVSIRHDRS